jgi:uncharacterized protein
MATVTNDVCDIWELARRGGEVQGQLPAERAARLAAELFDANGVLSYRLVGRIDERGRTAATLHVDGTVRVRCDRCGGPVEIPVRERAQFFFVADERALARLPIDEAPEEALLGSRRFDVAGLVEDQAILALPISPRHDDCALPSMTTDYLASTSDGETSRPLSALGELKRHHK